MAEPKVSLKRYQKRRDFKASPEPSGTTKRVPKKTKQPIFVIHKHAASHLHYDFRIEVDGVLTSWAVPKGFSHNPAEKHLAVPTDDHPYDYAKFEGVIPKGNYGAGTVMVWDRGTYKNLKDHSMAQCVKNGRIEVFLRGKKLLGGYALIRTTLGKGNQWLVLKMNDEYASRTTKSFPDENKSAKTGRTMDEITSDEIDTDGCVVQLSNQDKILFPDAKITKGDVIAYYTKIAPTMLPYMKDRAVTMHRFPDGITKEGFYQKDKSDYFPNWIKHVLIPKEGGKSDYVVCNDTATLVYLANQACITPHLWLSRLDKLDYPDRMIFDLDPGSKTDFAAVKKAGLLLHKILEDLGLTSFVMTTGSRGLHIVVPLDRKTPFDDVRDCARKIAEQLVAKDPEHYTLEARLAKRCGRLYIDVSRNAFAQTTVAPYSIRARSGAPVATPLEWGELKKKSLQAQSFTIKNVFARLKKVGDPWKKINRSMQSLKKSHKMMQLLKT